MHKTATVLLLVSILVACGDAVGPDTSVNGTWAGVTGGTNLLVSLSDHDGVIVGGGTIWGTGSASEVDILGSHTDTVVRLTITPIAFAAITFIGTHHTCGISGFLNGSGFTNQPYAFERDTGCPQGGTGVDSAKIWRK